MAKFINTLVAATFALTPMVGAVSANENSIDGCSCMSASAGTVTSVAGDVTLSGETGFVVGEVGHKLVAGSQLHTGENGSAVISFGSTCNVNVGSYSKASIFSSENNICAKVAKNELFENEGDLTLVQTADVQAAGVQGGVVGNGAAGGIGGGVGSGIGGGITTSTIIATTVIGGIITAVAVEAADDSSAPAPVSP